MFDFAELGRAAYEAYGEQAGGLTYDGSPLPSFADLDEERQQCWMAAARAVMHAQFNPSKEN